MTESSRKPTLEDVARAAGVSRALVSIVMRRAPGASDRTRARVLDVAASLGYRPDVRARLLARASTRLLGVVFRTDSLHHADLLAPIYDTAETAGYELILSGRTRTHDEQAAVNTLLGYRCDALLMIGSDLGEPDLTRLAESLPVVLAGRRMVHPAGPIDTVRTDEHAGMRLAVEHLSAIGHRDIVHVDGGPGAIAAERRRGYRAAMTRLGLRDHGRIIGGDGLLGGGERAVEELVAMTPRPTAVIAFNDEAAWGVMRGLRHAGLTVPGDVSVVGYDGTRLSRLVPRPLTTIRQDAAAIGREVVRRAIERLEGDVPSPTDEVLPPGFEIGETTGPGPG